MEPKRTPPARTLVEGSSTGALFMTLFGAVWGAAGAQALGGIAGSVSLVFAGAVSAALGVGALRLRRAAAGLPRDDSRGARAWRARSARRFGLVFGLQGAAIALAVFSLVRFGMETLVPPAVAVIVGVHFFPLAGLYGVGAYRATGAAMCATGVVALLLAPPDRLPFVGLCCAAALFATAAYALYLGAGAGRHDAPAA